MKIKIEATVDIDPQMWEQEYGAAPEEVEDDVKAYYAQILWQLAEEFNRTGAHRV